MGVRNKMVRQKEESASQHVNSGSGTQARIIEAAGEMFAESGYRYTTIRSICNQAGVNVAAVNYYFGGKKNLYLAVLKYWRGKAFEEYPLDLSDSSSQQPEELLHSFVRTFLLRVLDKGEGSRFARFVAQELMQPTNAFDVIIEETIRPTFVYLAGIVRRLLGAGPSDYTVRLCCISIVGQIFYFYISRPVRRRLFGKESLEKKDINEIADHIVMFSLNAIRQIAAQKGGKTI